MRFVTAFISLLLIPSALPAQRVTPFESEAPVAYLVDMSSGVVLYDKNSTRLIQPASMTKMMTALLVFDALAKDHEKGDEVVTISSATANRWRGVGSSMYLRAGEKVELANLLRGLVTLSGNDAAVALAEAIAGDKEKFVQQMNLRAKSLGMSSTVYSTANGWPDSGKTITTARDLAKVATANIHLYPELYRKFYGQPRFDWHGNGHANRDPLLGAIEGADGLKTGHTRGAGYCFTGSAIRKGRRLLMVVAGLPSESARVREARRLMQWGFDAWRNKPLYARNQKVGNLPVQLGNAAHIVAVAPHALAATLPKGDKETYRLALRYSGPIKAPIKRGQRIAELVVRFADGQEQHMPLVAANDVRAAGYFGRAYNGLKSLMEW